MERIRNRVAGLDVHRDSVVVCLRVAVGMEVETVKRSFSTTSAGIADLGDWLADHEVTTVVMESTGVYWKPVLLRVGGPVRGAVAAATPSTSRTSRAARAT